MLTRALPPLPVRPVSARTVGISLLSRPAVPLALSVIVSQAILNAVAFTGFGALGVPPLEAADIGRTWLYNIAWLLVLDFVKITTAALQRALERSLSHRRGGTAHPVTGREYTAKTPLVSGGEAYETYGTEEAAEDAAQSGFFTQRLDAKMPAFLMHAVGGVKGLVANVRLCECAGERGKFQHPVMAPAPAPFQKA